MSPRWGFAFLRLVGRLTRQVEGIILAIPFHRCARSETGRFHDRALTDFPFLLCALNATRSQDRSGMRCGCTFVKQGAGVDDRLGNTHPRLC